MKLSDIANPPEEPRHIVVEVTGAVTKWVQTALLNEGRWVHSGKKDYMLRVDPQNPSIPAQRHVHIAHKKHVSAPNKQASWNVDGTRHDKHNFNAAMGSNAKVQQIARQALALPDDVQLETIVQQDAALLLEASELITGLRVSPPMFRLKVSV